MTAADATRRRDAATGAISRSALLGAFASAARSSSAGRSRATTSRRASRWASASVSPGCCCSACSRVTRRPLLPPPGERLAAIGLGFVRLRGRVDVLLPGLERGTAAAVALIFYAYPAVVAIVEMRHSARSGCARATRASRSRCRSRAARSSRSAAARSRSRRPACCFVLRLGRDVLDVRARRATACSPRTDSLTAATWTAIGASVGVDRVRGRCADSCRCRRVTRSRRSSANGVRDRGRVHAVLRRARPDRADAHRDRAWRSKRSPASCWPRSSSASRVRPVVALGGVAVLAGAVIAALGAPARSKRSSRSSPP